MKEYIEILDNPFFQRVLAGLTTASILAILRFFRLKYLKRKYDFILGNWTGSYLISDDKNMVEQNIKIQTNLVGRLRVSLKEKTKANYIYKGKIDVVENTIYGYLKGQHHPGNSFFVLKLPFNRINQLPAMNGIFSGVTQHHLPASVKVHWSRTPISLTELRKELGTKKKFLILDMEATKNKERLDIGKHLKTLPNKV